MTPFHFPIFRSLQVTKRLTFGSLLLFLCVYLPSARGNELTNFPLRDEAYGFIKRLTVKYSQSSGLSTTWPLSRGAIAKEIIAISRKAHAGNIQLTTIEHAHLERLLWLFSNEIEVVLAKEISVAGTVASSTRPPMEFNPKKYVMSKQGKSYRFDLDPRVTQELAVFTDEELRESQKQKDSESVISITSYDLALRGKLGHAFGFADIIRNRFFYGR